MLIIAALTFATVPVAASNQVVDQVSDRVSGRLTAIAMVRAQILRAGIVDFKMARPRRQNKRVRMIDFE